MPTILFTLGHQVYRVNGLMGKVCLQGCCLAVCGAAAQDNLRRGQRQCSQADSTQGAQHWCVTCGFFKNKLFFARGTDRMRLGRWNPNSRHNSTFTHGHRPSIRCRRQLRHGSAEPQLPCRVKTLKRLASPYAASLPPVSCKCICFKSIASQSN